MVGIHLRQGLVEDLLLSQQCLVSLHASLEIGLKEVLQLSFTLLTLFLHHFDFTGQRGQQTLRLLNCLLGFFIFLHFQAFRHLQEGQCSLWLVILQHFELGGLAVIGLGEGILQEVLRSRYLVLQHLQLPMAQAVALLQRLRVLQQLFVLLLHRHDVLSNLGVFFHHLAILFLLFLQLPVEDGLLLLHAGSVLLLYVQHLLLKFLCLFADSAQRLGRFIQHGRHRGKLRETALAGSHHIWHGRERNLIRVWGSLLHIVHCKHRLHREEFQGRSHQKCQLHFGKKKNDGSQ
mmetsp:Transcript_48544/g.77222  ORF Transcript_48544/g.77222 Transcript_48544/m.77222 type:complete len:290 (-) Transcript_48544:21-890(-)